MERTMSNLRLFASSLGLTAGLALLVPASAAPFNSVTVSTDEVRVLSFQSPVKTVFVGNPTIADVTVIDSKHVFLLGKSFGTTNLVALDEQGRQTTDEEITVLNRQERVVTLQRGAARATLYCIANRCEAAPTPGDQSEPFDSVTGQIDRRQAQNLKSAAGQ
jgi:Flp pilus assembly secretin CpaC